MNEINYELLYKTCFGRKLTEDEAKNYEKGVANQLRPETSKEQREDRLRNILGFINRLNEGI